MQLLWRSPKITEHHQQAPELLMLPFGLLRLPKPCKVKRFLATEDLSTGGLVTGSSGIHSVKWKWRWRRSVVIKKNKSQWKRERQKDEPWGRKVKKKIGFSQLAVIVFCKTLPLTVYSKFCFFSQEVYWLKPQILLQKYWWLNSTFVFRWRQGVDFRNGVWLKLFLLLLLLVSLNVAPKWTEDAEEAANIRDTNSRWCAMFGILKMKKPEGDWAVVAGGTWRNQVRILLLSRI